MSNTPSSPPKSIPPAQAAHRDLVQRLRASPMRLSDLERAGIEAALMVAHMNVTEAARILGIGRTTIYRKIELYGIQRS